MSENNWNHINTQLPPTNAEIEVFLQDQKVVVDRNYVGHWDQEFMFDCMAVKGEHYWRLKLPPDLPFIKPDNPFKGQ